MPFFLVRVIASQAALPLVYVPLEAVASKWYGESERNLSEIFKAAEDLGGAIIFLDEIDSLATQRRCCTTALPTAFVICQSFSLKRNFGPGARFWVVDQSEGW